MKLFKRLSLGLALLALVAVAASQVPWVQNVSRNGNTAKQTLSQKWVGVWEFRHIDKDGKVLWKETKENFLADEGEEAFLDVFLRSGSAPSGFYIRLFNDTPTETDTLSDLTGEPSGNGYTAQAVARDATAAGWPTLALDSGDYMATSKTVEFIASGGSIGPVTYGVLATSTDSSGILVAAVALSTSRTMADGEKLQVTMYIKLSEAP
ncbi:MAG: hypothetical protein ABIJ37_07805 [Pseudomonadota bacterium]